MKITIFKAALFFICCITVLTSCDEEPYTGRRWVRYVSPDKKFSIAIPEGYRVGSISAEDELLGTYQESYVYWRFPSSWIDDMDIKLMEFEYFDIPQQYAHYPADKLLKVNMDQFMMRFSDSERKEIVPERVMVDSYPGLKIRGEWKEEGKVVFCKKYIVNNRIYTLWVSAYKDRARQEAIDSFVNSLKITGL